MPSPARVRLGGLARSGAIAGVIKLASAGLSFLMFLAIALVTDERQFGLFSATYAGASLVSFFASVGQQSAVLRFWPQYAGADLPAAQGFMARSIVVTLLGLLVATVGILAVGLLPGPGAATPEWLPLCLAAALLALALGWSEFASGAFRAKSALLSALLPRDVVWRALVILAVLGLWQAGAELSGVEASLLTAGLLLGAVTPQAVALLVQTARAPRRTLTPAEKREFTGVTLGLWGVTALPPALGQVSTLLVAVIVGPEAAGGIFVADRITRLILLAQNGLNQALAPEISAAFHNGRVPEVQRMTSLAAWGSTIAALLALLGLWLAGPAILAVFDPAYATPTMVAVLMIFAVAATVESACGPVEVLLQLTGAEGTLLRIVLGFNIVGLAATAVAAILLGPVGAALGIAGTVALWNLCAWVVARQRLGIDTSLFGVFR